MDRFECLLCRVPGADGWSSLEPGMNNAATTAACIPYTLLIPHPPCLDAVSSSVFSGSGAKCTVRTQHAETVFQVGHPLCVQLCAGAFLSLQSVQINLSIKSLQETSGAGVVQQYAVCILAAVVVETGRTASVSCYTVHSATTCISPLSLHAGVRAKMLPA